MEQATATLANGLPTELGEAILEALHLQVKDREHFERFYEVKKQISRDPKCEVYHVNDEESKEEYAIKKVVVRNEIPEHIHNMFLHVLKEYVLCKVIGSHINILRAYPEKNWIVLPDNVDGSAVEEVLTTRGETLLSDFDAFRGGFVNNVCFIWCRAAVAFSTRLQLVGFMLAVWMFVLPGEDFNGDMSCVDRCSA